MSAAQQKTEGHWCTDGVLGALAKHGHLTVREAAKVCGVSRHDAQRCLDVLRRRELAERPEVGRYAITRFGLEVVDRGARIRSGPAREHTGPRRPRRDSLQARVWRALRATQKATILELVQLAARGEERTPVDSARIYVKALVRAGYVVELKTREPGTAQGSNGFKRYLLTRDPGPKAPIFNVSRRTLRDPNSGEVHDLSEGTR